MFCAGLVSIADLLLACTSLAQAVPRPEVHSTSFVQYGAGRDFSSGRKVREGIDSERSDGSLWRVMHGDARYTAGLAGSAIAGAGRQYQLADVSARVALGSRCDLGRSSVFLQSGKRAVNARTRRTY